MGLPAPRVRTPYTRSSVTRMDSPRKSEVLSEANHRLRHRNLRGKIGYPPADEPTTGETERLLSTVGSGHSASREPQPSSTSIPGPEIAKISGAAQWQKAIASCSTDMAHPSSAPVRTTTSTKTPRRAE
jgi:hypothetical protein